AGAGPRQGPAGSGGVGPRADVPGIPGGGMAAQDALHLPLALLRGDVQLGPEYVDQPAVLAGEEVVPGAHAVLAMLGDRPGAQVLDDALERVGRVAELAPVAPAAGLAQVHHARSSVLEALVDEVYQELVTQPHLRQFFEQLRMGRGRLDQVVDRP